MIEQGQMRVYACGGGGINITSLLEKHRGSEERAAALISPVYIDTSRSNLARNRHAIDEKFCYMIEGLDGSGKIRAENYQQITEHVRDVLQQHKPLDINIVVSTAAGGSGSVIAPSLVSELLERKIPTIVVIVGSTSTRLDAENTLKTLKSYESISRMKKAPVIAAYVENSDKTPRSDVDKNVSFIILSLAILFSRQNHELDSQDLFNWLRYDRVTSFNPQLSALTVLDSREITGDLKELGNIISVATISNDPDNARFPIVPEYQCAGILPEDSSERFRERCPFNFIVSDGVFGDVVNRLNSFLTTIGETQAARIVKRNILGNDDEATDNGIIL